MGDCREQSQAASQDRATRARWYHATGKRHRCLCCIDESPLSPASRVLSLSRPHHHSCKSIQAGSPRRRYRASTSLCRSRNSRTIPMYRLIVLCIAALFTNTITYSHTSQCRQDGPFDERHRMYQGTSSLHNDVVRLVARCGAAVGAADEHLAGRRQRRSKWRGQCAARLAHVFERAISHPSALSGSPLEVRREELNRRISGRRSSFY